jgi:hypothetical protein
MCELVYPIHELDQPREHLREELPGFVGVSALSFRTRVWALGNWELSLD